MSNKRKRQRLALKYITTVDRLLGRHELDDNADSLRELEDNFHDADDEYDDDDDGGELEDHDGHSEDDNLE